MQRCNSALNILCATDFPEVRMLSERMSLTDAARLLRVSYHRALRLVLVGALDAEREDGRWRVSRASVERFLRERKLEPTPA
jgi:helix-turn-helix protein